MMVPSALLGCGRGAEPPSPTAPSAALVACAPIESVELLGATIGRARPLPASALPAFDDEAVPANVRDAMTFVDGAFEWGERTESLSMERVFARLDRAAAPNGVDVDAVAVDHVDVTGDGCAEAVIAVWDYSDGAPRGVRTCMVVTRGTDGALRELGRAGGEVDCD